MTDLRRALFDKIKSALNDGTADRVRRQAVADRLKSAPRHPLPARTQKPHAERLTQFQSYLEGQGATVMAIAGKDEIPAAVSRYLREKNLPQRVRMGSEPLFSALDWSSQPHLERHAGRAEPGDEAGLSLARAGVAETGTLVLTSGADNPVTLTFLPETHIVVVSAKDIVGGYEEAWPRMRALYGPGHMPRTVNFVSGPSRTADIASKLVMGAHGPRRLCVIVVRD
jgi:L-lactate dehydrogenase complex protein LldG